jgi:hypothetical protein
MEYYYSVFKKETLPFVMREINLEDIILREISQKEKEKEKHYVISYVVFPLETRLYIELSFIEFIVVFHVVIALFYFHLLWSI